MSASSPNRRPSSGDPDPPPSGQRWARSGGYRHGAWPGRRPVVRGAVQASCSTAGVQGAAPGGAGSRPERAQGTGCRRASGGRAPRSVAQSQADAQEHRVESGTTARSPMRSRREAAPRTTPKVAPLPGETPSTGSDVATVSTEGVEFPFPEYLQNVVTQIRRRWQQPYGSHAAGHGGLVLHSPRRFDHRPAVRQAVRKLCIRPRSRRSRRGGRPAEGVRPLARLAGSQTCYSSASSSAPTR